MRLAEAFEILCRRDSKAAEHVLRDILDNHPELAVTHVMFGQALAAENRWDEIDRWLPKRRRSADNMPITGGPWGNW